MRGKPHVVRQISHTGRIIPAHAGQTLRRGQWHRHDADHPRACGANVNTWSPIDLNIGSSPRMRGKHRVIVAQVHRARIIPAHAGQTCLLSGVEACWSDHPRACGANWRRVPPISMPRGSSPRMRGKLLCFLVPSPVLRIIPAHAGQTRG